MKTSWFAPAVAAIVVLVGGCSSEAGPGSTPSAVAADSGAAPVAWRDDLTVEQKSAFMRERVVPKMAPLFQAQDPVKYAQFSCATCHRDKLDEPHEVLPKLHVKGGQLDIEPEDRELAKFMAEKVVPTMAGILGEKPAGAGAKDGFGCGGCHELESR